MADKTKISWADSTLNPAYGCSKASPGCDHCYALRMAARMQHNPPVAHLFEGLVKDGEWTGQVNLFSVRQPWAWLIVNGFKGVENRTRPLPKSAQVRCCGNSVCPPMAAALAGANYPAEMPQRKSGTLVEMGA